MNLHPFFEKIFHNWPAKLLSFGLAVLLYAAFQIISLDSKSFSVPLKIEEGGSYTATETPPNSVRITIKGKSEEIAAIQENDIRAYIDTTMVSKPGISALPIKLDIENKLTLIDPFEVEVQPHSIELEFKENSFAWKPVEPVFKGVVLDGYEVGSWKATPSDIKITGIKSLVESTPALYTDVIDLNKRTESFTVVVPLESPNPNIEIIAKELISIRIEIVPQMINRTYTDITIKPYLLAPEFSLAKPLPLASLELSGTKKLLSTYNLPINTLQADFSGISSEGKYTIPLREYIHTALELVSINPTEVLVEIVHRFPKTQETVDEKIIDSKEPAFNDIIEDKIEIIEDNE